jgi:hypothetical protein
VYAADNIQHGTDIMNTTTHLVAAALALWFAVTDCVRGAPEPAGKPERKQLSSHDTIAEFAGTRQHRCMGRTSLCPDNCGHSGTLASFTIQHYLAYEKPGEYGDPQQAEYLVLVQDNHGKSKIPHATAELIRSLHKGDRVHLVWHHDYVTADGSSFPERTVVVLEKLSAEHADKLIAASKAKRSTNGP